ncbi:CHAT domain-containing protein [Streptomyces sp. NPDC008139]|uniref:CHAT domain-containing protein n=1 Tax=Streptomyces sp. NPDC008139 TaxID=3364814 RepID=UPI0036E461AF
MPFPQDADVDVLDDPSWHYSVLPPRAGEQRQGAPAATPLDLVVSLHRERSDELHITVLAPKERTPNAGIHSARLSTSATGAVNAGARLRSLWRDRLINYESPDEETAPLGSFPLTEEADLSQLTQVAEELTRFLVGEGHELLVDLLDGPGHELTAVRDFLLGKLGGAESLRVTFHSDVHLPWTMMATDPELESDGSWNAFLGHRHQVEQTGENHVAPQNEWQRKGPRPVTRINTDTLLESVGRAREVHKLLDEQTELTVCTRSDDFLRDLGSPVLDDEVIYFWCHGHFVANGSSQPHLVVRLSDQADIDASLLRHKRRRYERGEGRFTPFILLNACHTGQAAGSTELEHLGKAFVGMGAIGVLGPQIEVPQLFATEYAYAFLELYLTGEHTAGEIALALVRRFATEFHNPLALVYSLHCGIDSSLRKAA